MLRLSRASQGDHWWKWGSPAWPAIVIPSDVAWVPVVDLSQHQGTVSFATMRSRGVLGIILRVAHGMTLDARVATYYPQALAAGYQPDDVGWYSFVNPKRGSGPDTARFALEQILKVRGDLDTFYMIDVENYKDETPNKGSAPVYDKAFADYLRAHIKTVQIESPETRVIGYTNKAYWNGRISTLSLKRWVGDDELAGEIEWIIARYPVYSHAGYVAKPLPDTPAEWDEWAFKVAPQGPFPPNGAQGWKGWQFSAGFNRQGPVYGCSSSDLDLNFCYPEAWIRWTRQAPLPPPVPPNPPQEDEMIVTIFELVDSKAAFVGDTQINGLASHVRWSGPGDAKWLARRATILANGGRVLPASIGNLINFALDGPLPTGDPQHDWTGDEFANSEAIKAGHGPVVCHDEVAREGVSFVRAELESYAADEGALEARFERFLSMLRTSAGGD